MWALILGGLVLASVLGMIYLVSRFMKFPIVRKAAGGKRFPALLLGILAVAGIVCGTGAAFGAINAELVVLHLVIVWLVCAGAYRIAEKKRGKKYCQKK